MANLPSDKNCPPHSRGRQESSDAAREHITAPGRRDMAAPERHLRVRGSDRVGDYVDYVLAPTVNVRRAPRSVEAAPRARCPSSVL